MGQLPFAFQKGAKIYIESELFEEWNFNDEKPKCPTILHFGRQDQSIPIADVEVITSSHPEVDVYVYEADHGFHCDMRGQFNARAANIAGMRTIRLFDQHIGG